MVLLVVVPSMSCFNFGLLIAAVYNDKKDFVSKLKRSKYVTSLMIITIGTAYGLNLVFGQLGFGRVQSILSAITAFLIVSSLTFINLFQRFFSNKVSRFLGKISFPLYIAHLPIICSFTAFLMIKYYLFKENIGMALIIYSATVLLSLLIACCFYPVEKLSIWFSKKTYSFISDKD